LNGVLDAEDAEDAEDVEDAEEEEDTRVPHFFTAANNTLCGVWSDKTNSIVPLRKNVSYTS